jgi:methyltransferase (TIGR00027 family)
MQQGHASRTAEHNALFRALESDLPPSRRLFHDPLARGFLTWPFTAVRWLALIPGFRELVPWLIDTRWPGVRASVVARTRLIDEAIVAAVGDGIEQLVMLGAGFDARAYRLACLSGVAVFEVDHPDTQRAKRQALARALGSVPRHVTFVPIDFNREALASVMPAAGYRQSARTFILWEGVTNYLTQDGVDATLRWCASASPGSRLLFTYVHRDVLTKPESFVGTARLFATLAKARERLTFGIDPIALPDFLAERGLRLERDVGAAEYRQRYLKDAARKIRGHEFYRVAVARIAGAAHPVH